MSHGQSGKSIERRQWRVFPSFGAFIVIVGVHCEISESVLCWLPTVKSGIVKGLTYGPWSSNGAKETRSRKHKRNHQKRSQSNDLLWGHISAKLRSKRELCQCVCVCVCVYGLNWTHGGAVIQVSRDKRSLYIEKMQLSVSASTAVLYISVYKK